MQSRLEYNRTSDVMKILMLTTQVIETMSYHKSKKAVEADSKVKAVLESLSNSLYLTPYIAAWTL